MKSLACSLIAFAPSMLFAQGSLTPPGAPGPTMKSLDEIYTAATSAKSVATAINAQNTPGNATATFVISQPGSYYLAANLAGESGKSGIVVGASDVTIDLAGFTLTGADDGIYGITGATLSEQNIHITNGTFRNWADTAVYFPSSGRCVVSDLTLIDNKDSGISLGIFSRVENCLVQGGTVGFFLDSGTSIRKTTIFNTTGSAIALSSGNGHVEDCNISNCSYGIGESAGGDARITGCIINNITNTGISLCANNYVADNLISDCAVAGIDLRCGSNVVTRNFLNGNGIAVDTSNNNKEQVFANTLRDNTTNFTNLTGNYIAPTGNAGTATNPFTNLVSP